MKVNQWIRECDKEINFGKIGRLKTTLTYLIYELYAYEADNFHVCIFVINRIQESSDFITDADPVIRIELKDLDEGSNFKKNQRCSSLICVTCDFGCLVQPNA
jgi:hypothetical protein